MLQWTVNITGHTWPKRMLVDTLFIAQDTHSIRPYHAFRLEETALVL